MTTTKTSLSVLKEFSRKYFPGIVSLTRRIRDAFTSYRTKKNNYKNFETYSVKLRQPLQPHRKKVLHVIGNFWTGGSARLVIDIIEHIGHHYEQEVITRDVPPIAAYTGIPIHLVTEMDEPGPMLSALQTFQPALIHVHYLGHNRNMWGQEDMKWYRTIFLAAEQMGCPVIENINIPTEPFASSSVRSYVYVSDYVKQKFSVPNHPNEVIYPGSDFSHFNQEDASSVTDNCIGMVYRLERDKINEHSIDVFIEVVKRRRGTRALIVGGGVLLEHYKKVVHEAGLSKYFTFTGYVSYMNLPKEFKKMSVFVAPVHRESFGQVTPFAMSMRLPVAGYQVGAIPEIIANDTLLAPPGDYHKLADIIIDLLDNREKRIQIGNTNHERAHALYSVEKMVTSYQQLYYKIITGTKAEPKPDVYHHGM